MRIVTHKGWLEPLTLAHAEPLFHLIHQSRQHLHPWLPWLKRIHSPQDTAAFITRLIAERGPQFVINIDQQLCGGVGFYCLDRAEKKATIGYWLGSDFTGQGIMLDAVRHLCQYGFNHLQLQKIEIRCATDNLESRKVPERLGFYYEGVLHRAEWLSDRYVDHAVYTVLKDEFTLAFINDAPTHPETAAASPDSAEPPRIPETHGIA